MKKKLKLRTVLLCSIIFISCASEGADYPLLWDHKTDGRRWTAHTLRVIQNEVANDLMGGAADVETFCPRYHKLDNRQRANFWALLVSAIAKFESGFNPTDRYAESHGMGRDPVTGSRVWSEGLLQLSYGDSRSWAFCDFDWHADRRLPPRDPRRTILNPERNLSCGIKVLARQIRSRNRISLKVGRGAYWSVLDRRAGQIRAITKRMPGCMG